MSDPLSLPEHRLMALGIDLPSAPPLLGTYLRSKRHRELIFVAGAGPMSPPGHGDPIRGTVGVDLDLTRAREAAHLAGLNLLAALREQLGSLDHVNSILYVRGMVKCAPGFTDIPAVIDGCSDLLVEVFGPAGRHARAAIGVSELPLGIPVEIELVASAGVCTPAA